MRSWRDDALCAEVSPEIFFGEDIADAAMAKSICAACEVRKQCLDYALRTAPKFGIWAGTNERTRRKMRRELGYAVIDDEEDDEEEQGVA